MLESALAVPFQDVFGQALHKGVLPRAAALLRSLVMDHPFVDGNKRTAAALTRIYLQQNGYDLVTGQGELAQVTLSTAREEMPFDALVDWVTSHSMPSSVRDLASPEVMPWNDDTSDDLSIE